MNYKNAFRCKKCPECNDENGCPMWWETIWEKPSGEVKIIKACGYTQLPLYLIELVKASNRPAAAIESFRNEMVKGQNKFFNLIEQDQQKSLPGR